MAHPKGIKNQMRWISLALLLGLSSTLWAAPTGQWIWSRQDLALYKAHVAKDPSLEAGLFIATIHADRNSVSLKRALSPALVAKPRAIVIRFDDSFHGLWTKSDAEIAALLTPVFGDLLREVAATGAKPAEIQLDYDCPERHLARWANLLKALSSQALKGRDLWITSLPVHLNHDFQKLFQGTVSGHIPQVFDTGLEYSEKNAQTLMDRLNEAALPFRLGLGGFERSGGGDTTDHGRWQEALPLIKTSRWYQGLWIFPAGQPWQITKG